MRHDARRIRRLTDRAWQALDDEPRRGPADPVDGLTEALEALLAEIASNREAARRLRRTMDHSIQRETHRQTAHLKKAASTDPLTGMRNRRALETPRLAP